MSCVLRCKTQDTVREKGWSRHSRRRIQLDSRLLHTAFTSDPLRGFRLTGQIDFGQYNSLQASPNSLLYITNACGLHTIKINNDNEICKYADDTHVTYSRLPAANVSSRSTELNNITDWATANNISLNLSKSEKIVFMDKRRKHKFDRPTPKTVYTVSKRIPPNHQRKFQQWMSDSSNFWYKYCWVNMPSKGGLIYHLTCLLYAPYLGKL